jgi:hypothetical protein
MPYPLAHDHHGAIAQVEPPAGQLAPQGCLCAAIADLQARNTAAQFTQLGEVAAEGTASIEDQYRGLIWLGCRREAWLSDTLDFERRVSGTRR